MTTATRPREPRAFEERLLRELLAEAAIRAEHAPTPAVIAAPRRRPARRLVLAGGVTLTAALGASALLPALDGQDGSGPLRALSPLDAVAPAPATAGEVRRLALLAIEAHSDAIVHAAQITTTPQGRFRSEMWFDEAHPDRFRSIEYADDGTTVAIDSAMRGGSDGEPARTRTLNYLDGTWSETELAGDRAVWPAGLAAGLREQFALQHLTLLDRRTVRGREALVLQHDEPGMNRRLLVDAETFLPLRMTASWAPGERYIIDYTWLVRSPEREASLWPEPPADLRRVEVEPKAGKRASKAEQEG